MNQINNVLFSSNNNASKKFYCKNSKKITTLDKKIKFLNSQIFKFNVQTKKLGFF